MSRRFGVRTFLAAGLLWAAPAASQTGWDATLMVVPFPSPYLSDWETNPNIATYTLINGTDREQSVVLHYEVRNQSGQVVTAGRSDPQPVPPGVPLIHTSFTEIAGITEHDAVLEDQVTRSGRMPEGDYTACIVAASATGFVLAQVCETFTVVYPDPPMLVGPGDGEAVVTTAPIFQWTPLQVPIDFTLHYVLQLAEVRPGQTPYTALTANILHFENLDVGTTSLTYPVDGLPLTPGTTYAWRVVAIDQNGYAAATNSGSSEIWTFQYDDGTPAETPPPRIASSTMQLTVAKSDVPDEGENAGAYVSGLEAGLASLCASSDQWAAGTVDTSLNFDVRAPFFGDDVVTVTVYFGTTTDGLIETQQWAFRGTSTTRNWEYFARGDCDGPTDQPGLLGTLARIHWIAVRPKEYKISEYLSWAFGWNQPDPSGTPPATPPPHEGIELAFGTAVLSLRTTTVGDGEVFPAEAEFFGDNEIDVLPGLNAYGIVWLPEGGVWDWLRQFGFDENRLELQGFVGMANTVTVGAEIGSDGREIDASLQQKFLVLSLKFPRRTPQLLTFVQSMQAGLAFSIEDTLTAGIGSGAENKVGLDLILKFTWDWEINDDVSILWTGGFDLNTERKLGDSATSQKVDLVLSGECACVWESPFNVGNWWIGNPKLEMHYNLTTKAEMSIAASFQTGFGETPPFSVGGSLVWKRKPKDLPTPVREVYAMTEGARRQQLAALEKIKMLEADGATLAQLDAARAEHRRARELAETFEAELERVAKTNNVNLTNREAWDWRHPEWRVRAAAGNVGFMQLLDFFRSLW